MTKTYPTDVSITGTNVSELPSPRCVYKEVYSVIPTETTDFHQFYKCKKEEGAKFTSFNMTKRWSLSSPHIIITISNATQITSAFKIFYLFIYWLHWVFVAVHGFSLVAASGEYSVVGGAQASYCSGFCCGTLRL